MPWYVIKDLYKGTETAWKVAVASRAVREYMDKSFRF
jgi:hypothetical protein